VVTAITHTKAINYRRGQDNASTDLSRGDWADIAAHLGDLTRRGVKVVRIRQAVEALFRDRCLEPALKRVEEQLEAGRPRDKRVWLRYPLAVWGAESAAALGGPFVTRAQPPAWTWGLLHTLELWCAGQRVRVQSGAAFREAADGVGAPAVEVWLDGPGPWELRVEVPAEHGIVAERARDGEVRLEAQLPFKRAHVWVDGALHRDVSFRATPSGGAQATLHRPAALGARRK
jgi:hypothetical protein